MTNNDNIVVPAHIVNKSHYKWYQNNQTLILSNQKAYYEANKERIKANRRARYARKKAERLAVEVVNSSAEE